MASGRILLVHPLISPESIRRRRTGRKYTCTRNRFIATPLARRKARDIQIWKTNRPRYGLFVGYREGFAGINDKLLHTDQVQLLCLEF